MKYCEKCGNKLEEGVLFCEKCGTKVKEKEKKEIKTEEEIIRPVYQVPPRPPKPKGGILLTIFAFILFATTVTFMILWLTKLSSSCNTNNSENAENTEIDEPTKKDKRTVEYLLDLYVKAYTKADTQAVKDMFPSFYYEYSKSSFTKAKLEAALKEAKETYGNNFNVTYKITKTKKVDSDELEEINDDMSYYYDADVEATECYKYEGTITFKGSKSQDTDSIDSLRYCKFDGVWYLISN